MYVYLGTRAAYNDDGHAPDGTPLPTGDRAVLDGKRRVHVVFPPDTGLAEAFRTVTDPSGVWASQSPDPAPAWVASDSDGLAALLGEHYSTTVRPPLPTGERGEFPTTDTEAPL